MHWTTHMSCMQGYVHSGITSDPIRSSLIWLNASHFKKQQLRGKSIAPHKLTHVQIRLKAGRSHHTSRTPWPIQRCSKIEVGGAWSVWLLACNRTPVYVAARPPPNHTSQIPIKLMQMDTQYPVCAFLLHIICQTCFFPTGTQSISVFIAEATQSQRSNVAGTSARRCYHINISPAVSNFTPVPIHFDSSPSVCLYEGKYGSIVYLSEKRFCNPAREMQCIQNKKTFIGDHIFLHAWFSWSKPDSFPWSQEWNEFES